MRINSNDIRTTRTLASSLVTKSARKEKVGSVFNKVCDKSPFINSIRMDVVDGIGEFIGTRRKSLLAIEEQLGDKSNFGFIKKTTSFVGKHVKSAFKGAKATAKKAGFIPTTFAALGFCSGVPFGTSMGLTLGVIVKNVLKCLKNIKF